MKKITLLLILISPFLCANINAVVSILPQQTFLKAIGGDKVSITLMVTPGNSPHTYEPKPSQMIQIAKADLYFAIDVEFESVWLPKFHSLNPKMQIVDLADGITKLRMTEHHHEAHEHKHDAGDHHHEGSDPHIWTSPKNVATIAQSIYQALVRYDPTNQVYYADNLAHFLDKIRQTDQKIRQILSSVKTHRKFMVFHPSWGYFANAYDLEQIAIEVEGKTPKPQALVHILQEAREEQVSAIFTQPEFSDKVAKMIANTLHIPVIKVTPLAANWAENLIFIAHSIARKP